jgi:hypothetical protein
VGASDNEEEGAVELSQREQDSVFKAILKVGRVFRVFSLLLKTKTKKK